MMRGEQFYLEDCQDCKAYCSDAYAAECLLRHLCLGAALSLRSESKLTIPTSDTCKAEVEQVNDTEMSRLGGENNQTCLLHTGLMELIRPSKLATDSYR
ncbi:hypothetical protein Tco_0577998 [Tanacetum coccineum]